MEDQQTKNKPETRSFLQRLRSMLLRAGLVLLLIIAGMVYFRYFYTYSEGYRAGLLQKFSHKGNIFKTYEGELILSSVSGNNDVVLASEKFTFSVINREIVRQLDTVQGDKVIVHYIQKKRPVFWRGDSEYLVDSVRVRR